jgi:hypothetical protein
MTIRNNGNVGIGTASPGVKLQVGGNAETTPQYIRIRGERINQAGDICGIQMYNSANSGDRGNSRIINSRGANNYGSDLEFWTNPDSNVPATEKMRITSEGDVGIGTHTPKTLVHIGTHSAGSGTHNTIPSANMGVSANFPDSTNVWLSKHSSAQTEDYWGMALGTQYSSGNSYIQTLDKSNTQYYNLLLQPNGGNVGIGTAPTSGPLSTGAKLDVNGVIKNKNPAWSVYKGSTGGNNSGILQYNSSRCTAVNVTMNTTVVGGLTYFYRATITIAGRYYVGFHGFGDPNQAGSGSGVDVYKNGGRTVRNYNEVPNGHYGYWHAPSLGVILDLAVNDYIEIYSQSTLHHNHNAMFHGFMIG